MRFSFFASLFIVIRRFFLLIFTPYKTMRKIAQEKDVNQVLIIGFLILFYFYFSSFFRKETVPFILIFSIFLFNFSFTIFFFYLLSKLFNKNLSITSFIFTFSYSLIPTLLWFFTNSFLYVMIPPPRTASMLGQSFSIFFITFSLSLLFWKLILFYLSVRFSSRQNFYRVIYFILLYLVFLTPFSYFMYYLKIFRIPFI